MATFSSISVSGLGEGWGEKTEVPAKEERKRDFQGRGASPKEKIDMDKGTEEGKVASYLLEGRPEKTASLLIAVIFTAVSKSLKLSFIKSKRFP